MLQLSQMSKKVKFVLNTGEHGGRTVIQEMARPAVVKAAERIAERADLISGAMRKHPNTFKVTEVAIGLPNSRGGRRVYARIDSVEPSYGEARNMDDQALHLALDAGRVGRLGA